MGKGMTKGVREQTEIFLSMINHGLEGLAELHGNPKHIGAGMRREKNGALFVYITDPSDGVERPGEIWMPHSMEKRAALLFNTIPASAKNCGKDETANPHYNRKSGHFQAAVALAAAGGN